MRDKVSVIIPVYNVEAYLERCLKSVAENTYRNLEIICVNDGSTDGSGAILDRFAQQDARFVVIHKENGGASSARNRGLDAATGEFIAFVDSDDWVHPQYFEILLHFQKEQDYDLVICGYLRVSQMEPCRELSTKSLHAMPSDLAGVYRTHAKRFIWGRLFRGALIGQNRFDETMKTDEDSAFNGFVLGNWPNLRVCDVAEPLYFYYIRPGSLVFQIEKRHELELATLLYEYAKKIKDVHAKYVILLEGLKRCATARYELSLYPNERKSVRECDKKMRDLIKALCELPNVSIKNKIVYWGLGLQPGMYRLFLLLKNPNLRQWEKEQKKLHAKKESGH